MPPSFAEAFPVAYHVFPLHLAKSIWQLGLLSRVDRERHGIQSGRPSSSPFDEALGFGAHVHFYLHKDAEAFAALPILKKQLGDKGAFPHVVLSVPTRELGSNRDLTVCVYNIGRSKPGVGSVVSGDTPASLVEIWEALRRKQPRDGDMPVRREIGGQWKEPYKLPVMSGAAISVEIMEDHFKRRKRSSLELLCHSPFAITPAMTLYAFSNDDLELLRRLGPGPAGGTGSAAPACVRSFGGYRGRSSVKPAIYAAIEAYFASPELLPLPDLFFD